MIGARYLSSPDIAGALRRGKSVEQFSGRSPLHGDYIRHIELRSTELVVEVWVYDVEDVGHEEWLDLYAFPYFDPDGPEDPAGEFPTAAEAIQFAVSSLSASPDRWVNQGMSQHEYLDFIRAGRPAQWP